MKHFLKARYVITKDKQIKNKKEVDLLVIDDLGRKGQEERGLLKEDVNERTSEKYNQEN